jgi:hypothetical protein
MTESMLDLQVLCFEYFRFLRGKCSGFLWIELQQLYFMSLELFVEHIIFKILNHIKINKRATVVC